MIPLKDKRILVADNRKVLGMVEGAKEDKSGWSTFLPHLKERGLNGIELMISDACLCLVVSGAEHYPEARRQRYVVHWYRNTFSHTPSRKVPEVARMLKVIHHEEDPEAAREKVGAVVEKLKAMTLGKAAELVEKGVEETLTYYHFPTLVGDALERTTRSSASSERYAGELALSVFSRPRVSADARRYQASSYRRNHVGYTTLSRDGIVNQRG